MSKSSIRAQIIERRTYMRPLDSEGTIFESRDEHFDRVIGHQRYLWERAKAGMVRDDDGKWETLPLTAIEEAELQELKMLLKTYKVRLAGRTHWMGGTPTVWKREISNFNCSALNLKRPADYVDAFWLLLNGTGFGFRPVNNKNGQVTGFNTRIDNIYVQGSSKGRYGGEDYNTEYYDAKNEIWYLRVGDSAEAWSKFLGKLLSRKYKARTLVLDYSQLRGPGYRLKGYGWICCGWEPLSEAVNEIVKIMNNRVGQKLTDIDSVDILNLLGQVLSTRRAAEIAFVDYGTEYADKFAMMKKDYWSPEINKPWRAQSNNSLGFWSKPSRPELEKIFAMMQEAGGSEPGFYNFEAANKRAPYYTDIANPCGEILLNGDGSLCNLVETVVCHFNGNLPGLMRAHMIVSRANYRQTCVDLNDGVLQSVWDDQQKYLRLCGAGLTGITAWEYEFNPGILQMLREAAVNGADSMADELGMNRAQLVTTIKPSGTASKTCGYENQEVPEGAHKPLGKYIFNNVNFMTKDPIVDKLKNAGYSWIPHPFDPNGILVKIPAKYDNIEFDKAVLTGFGECEVNLESAVKQLERYKWLMKNYVDHNCSITVSYDPSEVPSIIDWLMENWDDYVGVAFLYRNDPTKTAEDLGFAYLPQAVVSKKVYEDYVATLSPVSFDTEDTNSFIEVDSGPDCATGACPVR